MNPNHPHYAGLGSGPNLNLLDNMLMAAGFQVSIHYTILSLPDIRATMDKEEFNTSECTPKWSKYFFYSGEGSQSGALNGPGECLWSTPGISRHNIVFSCKNTVF